MAANLLDVCLLRRRRLEQAIGGYICQGGKYVVDLLQSRKWEPSDSTTCRLWRFVKSLPRDYEIQVTILRRVESSKSWREYFTWQEQIDLVPPEVRIEGDAAGIAWLLDEIDLCDDFIKTTARFLKSLKVHLDLDPALKRCIYE
jgi:hypothetical protein